MNNKRITANPQLLGGKPMIRGTRLSVEFILDLFASGMTESEILEDYSHITAEDIQACLRYAAHAFKNEIYIEFEPAVARSLHRLKFSQTRIYRRT